MLRRYILSAMAAVAASALPAMAQVDQRPAAGVTPCVLDKCIDGPGVTQPAPASPPASAPAMPRAVMPPGTFDFYVLSLSWSPGFCDTGGAERAGAQCADGANLGFVVHGLWPQFTRGFPSDCDSTARSPSRSSLDSVSGLYPDAGLARYEWRKHGTCTGLSPTDYFASVRRAREAVAIPSSLQSPREPQTLAPLDIARAFAQSNQGLRPDMMAVTCRQDELEEVRICFTRDLRGFTSCPEVARGACRTRAISVLPIR